MKVHALLFAEGREDLSGDAERGELEMRLLHRLRKRQGQAPNVLPRALSGTTSDCSSEDQLPSATTVPTRATASAARNRSWTVAVRAGSRCAAETSAQRLS